MPEKGVSEGQSESTQRKFLRAMGYEELERWIEEWGDQPLADATAREYRSQVWSRFAGTFFGTLEPRFGLYNFPTVNPLRDALRRQESFPTVMVTSGERRPIKRDRHFHLWSQAVFYMSGGQLGMEQLANGRLRDIVAPELGIFQRTGVVGYEYTARGEGFDLMIKGSGNNRGSLYFAFDEAPDLTSDDVEKIRRNIGRYSRELIQRRLR